MTSRSLALNTDPLPESPFELISRLFRIERGLITRFAVLFLVVPSTVRFHRGEEMFSMNICDAGVASFPVVSVCPPLLLSASDVSGVMRTSA